MTVQEQQMLQELTARISHTQLSEKDPDAERYLQDTLGRNPDALYILAQTTLVQEYALKNAQKQLAEARAEVQQARQHPAEPKHSTSFLGSLLGLEDKPAAPPPPRPVQMSQPQYTPVPNYAQQGYTSQQYGAPQYGSPQAGGFMGMGGGGQSGGFLQGAMRTAAGVAAGALAFEGIESLMHGFGGGHSGLGLGDFGGAGRGETINNYYGDATGSGRVDSGMQDVEDRRDDNAGSSQSADTSDAGDSTYQDDSSSDAGSTTDSFADDSSSSFGDSENDSGGSFDSGGGGSDDSSF